MLNLNKIQRRRAGRVVNIYLHNRVMVNIWKFNFKNIITATYTYIEYEDDALFEYVLDHKELHNFALQIANGMRFLEEQEIVHR